MKSLMSSLQIMLCGVMVCLAVSTAKSGGENYDSSSLTNRIEGIVWDPNRRPVSDIYVELQNEIYSTVGRVRTDSTGHYLFIGIPSGHYNIKVLTSGTNYLDYTEAIDLVGVVQGGSESVNQDIYLKFDKSKVNSGFAGITDVVFVQEVPEEARKLYKKGVKDINDGDKGFDEMKEALKVFPAYYDALNTLGREYVARKEYQKSLEYLIRSIDINQRSFSSFYALAYACYQLNHRPEALEAAKGATIIQPNSVNAQLLYGTLLRLDGSYEKAEKVLLEAKKLSKDTLPEVHWQLALLYNRVGRNKEAADELGLYLKAQPDARNKKEIQDLIAKLRKESK
jgi:tetratricopeptide (TPR) repeat protein